MALEVTGYVTSPGYGLRIDLHEGATEVAELAEVYSFGPDGDKLFVVDAPHYDHSLPGKIGEAVLTEEFVEGLYEATYDFGDEALEKWGHRGIMTSAMGILLKRVVEQDIHAREVRLIIDPENVRSIGLAKKLGARLSQVGDGLFYELMLTDFVQGQQGRPGQHV